MTDRATTVIYNGACPICAREIAGYRRQAERGGLPLRFVDLDEAGLAGRGLTPDQAARRLHVEKNGEIHAGLPAFALLWDQLPRFRWLARAVRLPGVSWLADRLYEGVLAPALYAMHRRRQSRLGKDTARG